MRCTDGNWQRTYLEQYLPTYLSGRLPEINHREHKSDSMLHEGRQLTDSEAAHDADGGHLSLSALLSVCRADVRQLHLLSLPPINPRYIVL